MLQEFRKQGHDSWVPECKVGVGVTICFTCEDALAFFRQVTARGIQARPPFVGNAMWVTNLSDPDGYELRSRVPRTRRRIRSSPGDDHVGK